MKRPLLILALTLSALVAIPAPAAEAQTTRVGFSFHGDMAEAGFSSVDASGCVVTDVFVFAIDGRIIGPGVGDVRSAVAIDIFQFDVCADRVVFAFSSIATLAADEFQITDRLKAATLNTTVEGVESVSGASINIDIHVTWTGEGAIFRQKDRFQTSERPGNKLMVFFDRVGRSATASGTVTFGTTNFTPEPALFANISSVKEGELEIIHE